MASIYDRITADMIARIEKGASKYEMPWHAKGSKTDALPVNAVTGKLYSGMNCLLFWSQQSEQRYESATWATYKQWQALGAQVRKGERSTHGVFWKRMDSAPADDAGENQPTFSRLVGFGFNVFNAAQVDGWSDDQLPEIERVDRTQAIAVADTVIAASGADIRHGGTRAYYRRADDFIQMPDRFRFTGSATSSATSSYYATKLHELVHWTGAPHRLDREKGKRFGDAAYAFEELVAEIGSAFLCARLGIDNEPRADHANYVASWIKVLQNDNRAIFHAASLAQKACDYLLNRIAAPAADPLPLAA